MPSINSESRSSSETLLIKGARLWNGIDDSVVQDGAVLIENDRIKAVGPWEELVLQPRDRTLDFPGATLLPGLIDSHTHLSMDPTLDNYLDRMSDSVAELTLRATAMMRKDLQAGITTCRCLGDREFLDIACRKAVQEGLVEGPNVLVATRGIRAPHGHGFVGYPFEGPDGIRNAIKENLAAGADFIKIYITGTLKGDGQLPSYLSREEIKTAIDTAHEAGARVASHCVGGEGLDWALELGLDTLEHAYHITEAQIERLVQSETFLVLTPSPIMTEARIRHLPSGLIQGHLDERREISANMAATIATGMPFAVGTDGMHGDLAQEVKHLAELGASRCAALKAATINGAIACDIEQETGSLETGKYADVIAAHGNPLEDLNALDQVIAVMRRGRLMHQTEPPELDRSTRLPSEAR